MGKNMNLALSFQNNNKKDFHMLASFLLTRVLLFCAVFFTYFQGDIAGLYLCSVTGFIGKVDNL